MGEPFGWSSGREPSLRENAKTFVTVLPSSKCRMHRRFLEVTSFECDAKVLLEHRGFAHAIASVDDGDAILLPELNSVVVLAKQPLDFNLPQVDRLGVARLCFCPGRRCHHLFRGTGYRVRGAVSELFRWANRCDLFRKGAFFLPLTLSSC